MSLGKVTPTFHAWCPHCPAYRQSTLSAARVSPVLYACNHSPNPISLLPRQITTPACVHEHVQCRCTGSTGAAAALHVCCSHYAVHVDSVMWEAAVKSIMHQSCNELCNLTTSKGYWTKPPVHSVFLHFRCLLLQCAENGFFGLRRYWT